MQGFLIISCCLLTVKASIDDDGSYGTSYDDSSSSFTSFPTDAPSAHPTFSPTSPPVVPELPAFSAFDTAFDIIATTVAVEDISAVELLATASPTSSPTFAGYAAVAVEKEVKTVKATVGFPLTQDEATHPVMKLAIESGVASSLGLDAGLVKITSAGGVATLRRRLVENLAIEFEIQSPAGADAAQATILQTNLETAATTGALVTHVQAKAATAGVLVEALKAMPAVIDALTVVVATKTVTVIEQRRSNTNAPTATPTAAPTAASTDTPTADTGSTDTDAGTGSDTATDTGVSGASATSISSLVTLSAMLVLAALC